MSAAAWDALVLGAAFLLGSIPFGLLVARAATGADVRLVGSGNIGATNVLRASGPVPAIVTLLLDIGKGAGAVLLARAASSAGSAAWSGAGAGPSVAAGAPTSVLLDDWAGLAAAAGHMYSPWLGFRGGKGVATSLGVLAVLSPWLAGAALAVFGIVVGLTRIVSLGSIAACVAIPLLLASGAISGPRPSFVVAFGLCALILIRHRANVARLLRGSEPRLGAGGEGRGPGPGREGPVVP